MPRKSKAPRGLWARFTRAEIAEFAGVSPSTVSRWKSRGIPNERLTAIKALTETRKNLAPLKKALKASVDSLAAVAGVTRKTARGWKEKGEIPERFRARFFEEPGEEAPRMRGTTNRTEFVGRISRGVMTTVSFPENGTILDSRTTIETLTKLDESPEPRFKVKAKRDEKGRLQGTTYQLTAVLKSEIGFSETLSHGFGSAKAIELKRINPNDDLSDLEAKLALSTFAHPTKEGAIRELELRLASLSEEHSANLLSATLFVRRPK